LYSVSEGGTLTVTAALGVLANDTDADGSILTAIRLTNTVNGSLVFNADGSFTYTHNGSETSSDSFTYKCNDGTLDGNVVAVMILVDAVNGAPVTFPDSYTVSEGATLTVPSATGLLANDTDSEGETLTAIKLSDPVNGTLTFNSNGSFTYVHNGSETASDSFTYRATDGTLNGNIATVTLTVTPVNDLPVVSDIAKQVNEDNTLTFSTADFTAAYADAEGTVMDRIRITSLPANGTLRFMNNPVSANDEIAAAQLGLLTFTPATDWSGTVSFGWNGSDGTAYAAAPATVTVNVVQVNEAPQIINPVLRVTMDQATGPHTSSIASNVVNTDGDILLSSISVAPKNGTASVDVSGNILYTPDPSYAGKDSLTYQVCDNGTPPLCATGKIVYTIVVVVPPNNAPVITDIEKEMRQGDVLDFSEADFTAAYTDSDKDALASIKITALPAVGTLTLNGVAVSTGQVITAADIGKLKYSPPGSFHGETYFSWTANDGEDWSLPAAVNITVTERDLFIPEGFSPNGDGVNDFFVIQGADEFVVSLKVYNRWGNLVYQNREYLNDWDGISNSGLLISTKLPDGTYYYIVNFNNGEKDQVGYITINR
jgi:gliding motility-associated-like protein